MSNGVGPVGYFYTSQMFMELMREVFQKVGDSITARGNVYHRGAFYEDAALAIGILCDRNFASMKESEYNWRWWADELKKRALAVGTDAPNAMKLPGRWKEDRDGYENTTNYLDLCWRQMFGAFHEEEIDYQTSPMGDTTPAECVKITWHFLRWLEKTLKYKKLEWQWVGACKDELLAVFTRMGETTTAGGWTPGGGPMPPISWPGQ
ncbi:MAG TPA: hypothetical protein VMW79_08015 [Anaerolineae bacterium]|nr:hypothetical protein [Anaerolineae bacterium]